MELNLHDRFRTSKGVMVASLIEISRRNPAKGSTYFSFFMTMQKNFAHHVGDFQAI